MKVEINDLLLKMKTGENCIGETANKLFNTLENLNKEYRDLLGELLIILKTQKSLVKDCDRQASDTEDLQQKLYWEGAKQAYLYSCRKLLEILEKHNSK